MIAQNEDLSIHQSHFSLSLQDNNLCAYSIEYGRTSDYLEAHSDAISCMDWRSGVLATGSWDSTVKLWQCSEVNGYR